MIGPADKLILETAISGGLYDPVADLNADFVVDIYDYLLFRRQYAATAEVVKHAVPGEVVPTGYYITRGLEGAFMLDNNSGPAILSSDNGKFVADTKGGLFYRMTGAEGALEDVGLIEDIRLFTFNDGSADVGTPAWIGGTLLHNGISWRLGGSGIEDIALYREQGCAWCAKPEKAFGIAGDILSLQDLAPAGDLENIWIDGKRYRLNADDPQNVFLEGPVSESAHLAAKEKEYIVVGTSPDDVIVIERAALTDMSQDRIIGMSLGGRREFFDVTHEDVAGQMSFVFDDGIYPVLVSEVGAVYTTVTTLRTIELEGIEYKVTYDATTGTYDLYGETGALALEDQQVDAIGTYTTEIAGIVYRSYGTSADDLELVSMEGAPISAISNKTIVLDGRTLEVAESQLARPALQSDKYDQKAVSGLGILASRKMLQFSEEDFEYNIEGWSDTRTSECDNTTILGGYGNFAGTTVTKTYTGVPAGKLRIGFDYYFLDSWDGYDDKAYLEINGVRVWEQVHTYNSSEEGLLTELPDSPAYGDGSYKDWMGHFEVEYENTGGDGTLEVTFGSALTDVPTKESWGVGSVTLAAEWAPNYDVLTQGSQYILKDAVNGATFTSTTDGSQITVDGIAYDITTEGDDIVFTEVREVTDAVASDWIDLKGTYYKVTDLGGGSYNLSNELGESHDVEGGRLAVVNDGLYKVSATSPDDIEMNADYMRFDGTNDYIRVDGLSDDLSTGDDFTLAVWFNTTDVPDLALGNEIFSAHQGSSNRLLFGTGVNGGIYCSNGGEHGSGYNDGNWHLVTLSIAGTGETTVRVDNVEIPGYGTSQINWDSVDRVSIGQEWDASPSDYFNGLIDEVGVFKKILSPAEIQAIMEEGITGSEADILAYYSFDEGTAADNSVNMNDGEMFNGVAPKSFTSQHMTNDTSITVKGVEYMVFKAGGKYEILNNGLSLQETDEGFIVFDDAVAYEVSEIGNMLRMEQLMKSDIDRDGDIDADDEAVIIAALSSGVYDRAADLNYDSVVNDYDHAIFRTQRATTADVFKHFVPGTLGNKDYYVVKSPDGIYRFCDNEAKLFFSDPEGELLEGIGGMRYLVTGAGVDSQNLITEDINIYTFSDGAEVFGSAMMDDSFVHNGAGYRVIGTGPDDLALFKEGTASVEYSGAAFEVGGVNYRLTGSEGAWVLSSGTKTIAFGADNTGIVGGIRYYVNADDPENIILEGPATRSSHVLSKEKTYIIEGTGVDDLVISEVPKASETVSETAVFIKIGDDLIYYGVYTTAQGDLAFDDGVYPPIVAEAGAEYSTFSTHRVIDLEGAQYRVTYEASTNTCDLYDSAGALFKADLAITADGEYTTEIDGIVYKMIGNSADDFTLESVKDISVSGTTDDTMLLMDGDIFKVTEAELTRSAFTSTALDVTVAAFNLDGSVYDELFYEVEAFTAGSYSNYAFTDIALGSVYTSSAEGTEVVLDGVCYLITDETTTGGGIILEEKQEIANAISAEWIELETELGVYIYYRVTEVVADTYQLDTAVPGEEPIIIQNGYTTEIAGTVYTCVATSVDDLVLWDYVNMEFSSDISDHEITIKGEDFFILDDAGTCILKNNVRTLTEDVESKVHFDLVRPFAVTGSLGTLQLDQIMISDMDGDNDIDTDDEAIIRNSVTGVYTAVADLNGDMSVTADDLELFYMQWTSTEYAVKHSIPGRVVGGDYYVTEGIYGEYHVDSEAIDRTSSADGLFMGIDEVRYRTTGTSLADLVLEEDLRVFTFSAGAADIGASMINGEFKYNGMTYSVSGTMLENITLTRDAVTSSAVTDPVYLAGGDLYSMTGTTGSYEFYDGTQAIVFDAGDTGELEGTRYEVDDTNPSDIVLEGPANISSHVAEKEKTLRVDGTVPGEAVVSEIPAGVSPADLDGDNDIDGDDEDLLFRIIDSGVYSPAGDIDADGDNDEWDVFEFRDYRFSEDDAVRHSINGKEYHVIKGYNRYFVMPAENADPAAVVMTNDKGVVTVEGVSFIVLDHATMVEDKPADLDKDGVIGPDDEQAFMDEYNNPQTGEGDLNADGVTDREDLDIFLGYRTDTEQFSQFILEDAVYHIERIGDEKYRVYDENGAVITSDNRGVVALEEGSYITAEGEPDELANVTMIEEKTADINKDGLIDAADEQFLASQVASPRIFDIMNFDGLDDHVRATIWPDYDNMTLSVWAKVQPEETSAELMGWTNSDTSYQKGFSLEVDGDYLRVQAWTGASYTKPRYFYDNVYYDISGLKGQWAHYAATWRHIGGKNIEVCLYVNGELVSSAIDYQKDTHPYSGAESPFSMGGAYNTGLARTLYGSLFDASVWSKALGEEAMTEMYEGVRPSSIDGFTTSCQAWWKFDEGSGDTLNDSSPNGVTATTYNGAIWSKAEILDGDGEVADINDDGKVNDLDLLMFRRSKADASLLTKQLITGDAYFIEKGLGDKYYIHSLDGSLLSGVDSGTVIIGETPCRIIGALDIDDTQIMESKFCDLNADGILDDIDEAIIVGAMTTGVYTVAADLDRDGDVDGEDYFIFKAQRPSVNTVSLMIEMDEVEYYLSERDENTYMLTPVAGGEPVFSQHKPALAPEDTMFDSLLDLDYIIGWDIDIENVEIKEKLMSDLDADGDVDMNDWAIMELALGSVKREVKDGIETSARLNWQEDLYSGNELAVYALASDENNYVEYEFNILQGGSFDVKLQVKNDSPYNALPESYQYAFDLYLDGDAQKIGTIYADGDDVIYVEGTINIADLSEGIHTLRFVWANAADARLAVPGWAQPRASIRKVSVISVNYDARADLNFDGLVNEIDFEIFAGRFSDTSMVQRLVIGNQRYYILEAYTEDKYVIYDKYGRRIETDENNKIVLQGIEYTVKKDDQDVISFEFRADIDGDGYVDADDEAALEEAMGSADPFEFPGAAASWQAPNDDIRSMTFDGVNDYILTDIDIDQYISMSFEAWVYQPSGSAGGTIISTDEGGWDWSFRSAGGTWRAYDGDSDWNTGFSVDVDKWQHVVVVYDYPADLMYFYKNGERLSRYDISGDSYVKPIAIGRNQYQSGGNYFNGRIDEVAVYDRTLSQEEVLEHFEKGLTGLAGQEEGLLAYYSFDDGTAQDLSGEGYYDGTVYGAVSSQNEFYPMPDNGLAIMPFAEPESPYKVTYQFGNIYGNGHYDIGLEIRSFYTDVIPMQDFPGYRFLVTVDGEDVGTIEVPPSRNVYLSDSVSASLEDGAHTVTFTWLNPEEDLNVEIGKVFVKDAAYVEKADINADGIIDEKDVRLFGFHRLKGEVSQTIELEGETYFAAAASTGKVVLTDTAGNRYSNAETRVPGKALRFDGDNDYITASYSTVNSLSDFTVSCKVKLDRLANTLSTILSGANKSTPDELMTRYNAEMDRWELYIGGFLYAFDVNSVVEDLAWHTVTITRKGGMLYLYIDGYLASMVVTSPEQIDISPSGFVIGRRQGAIGGRFAPQEAFKGEVDDLSVWARALTADEALKLHTGVPPSYIAGFDENCRAWWEFDEGIGNVLPDNTANYYNGTIFGCAWKDALYEFENPEYGVLKDTIEIPLPGEPDTVISYFVGIDPDTELISLAEENIYDLNKDANFDTRDRDIMLEGMDAYLIEKDANDFRDLSETGYAWEVLGDDTISNGGFADPAQEAPWVEYLFEIEQDDEYYVGISARNDTAYSKPCNWMLPWGSEAQKWEIFSDNFRKDLTAGVYTTAEGDLSGTIKMDITGPDPCLYYTRYYSEETDPALRQGWADGSNDAIDLSKIGFVEICYRYTGTYTPDTAGISWSPADQNYYWDEKDNLKYTHEFDVTGVKDGSGEFKTVLINMSEVQGWEGEMEAFRFDPAEGGVDSGTVEIKYIAFKELENMLPAAHWGDYPTGVEQGLKFRVYVDDVYYGMVTLPWESTAQTLDFYTDSLRMHLEEGEHRLRFEWMNDYGEETALKVERAFVTNITNTTADLTGDYIVNDEDADQMRFDLGVNLASNTLEFGDDMYEVTEVETFPGSGEYVYEFRRFTEDASIYTSNITDQSVTIAGASYNLYVDTVEGGMMLSSKGLLSLPIYDGRVSFKEVEYDYEEIEDGRLRLIETIPMATAHDVQHPNWTKEIEIAGRTYGVIEAMSGKVTFIPAEREEIVASAVSDYTTGTNFLVNNVTMAPQAGDVCMRDGVTEDPATWTPREGINIVVIDEDTGEIEYTSWDCGNAAYVEEMSRYLRNLSEDTIVMVSKEGANVGALDERAYLSLEASGSAYIRALTATDTWSMVGYMGAPEGTVVENFHSDHTAAASNSVVYIKDDVHPKSYRGNTRIDVDGVTYVISHDDDGMLVLSVIEKYESYFDASSGDHEIMIAGTVYDITIDADNRLLLSADSDAVTEGGRGTVIVDGHLFSVSAKEVDESERLTQEERDKVEIYSVVSSDFTSVFMKDDVSITPLTVITEPTHFDLESAPTDEPNMVQENCMSFDGNDVITAAVNISETSYTVSLWFKTTATDARGLFQVWWTSGGQDRNIYISGGDVYARLYNGTADIINTTGENYADGQWHHVVHVFGGDIGSQRIYVDGELKSTGTHAASSNINQNRITIGDTDYQSNFIGSIDEVAAYNRALSEEEIQELATSLPDVSDPDLEAYYSFDGDNAADDSGNGHTGTINGATWVEGTDLFLHDRTYTHYNNGDHINVPYGAIDGLTDLTATFRVKADALQDDIYLIDSDGTDNLSIYYDVSAEEWRVVTGIYSCGALDTSLADNEWHMVSVTRESDQVAIYVDGMGIGSYSTAAIPVSVLTTDVYVGRDIADSVYPFEGSLRDISIWERALTPAEIEGLYTTMPVSAVADYTTNCRAWWPVDDGSGALMIDETGNGYDGAINGAEWDAFTDTVCSRNGYLESKDTWEPGDGINIVHIRPGGRDGADFSSWDIQHADEMGAYITALYSTDIREGSAILVSKQGDFTAGLTENALSVLENLGSSGIRNVQTDESWSMAVLVGEFTGGAITESIVQEKYCNTEAASHGIQRLDTTESPALLYGKKLTIDGKDYEFIADEEGDLLAESVAGFVLEDGISRFLTDRNLIVTLDGTEYFVIENETGIELKEVNAADIDRDGDVDRGDIRLMGLSVGSSLVARKQAADSTSRYFFKSPEAATELYATSHTGNPYIESTFLCPSGDMLVGLKLKGFNGYNIPGDGYKFSVQVKGPDDTSYTSAGEITILASDLYYGEGSLLLEDLPVGNHDVRFTWIDQMPFTAVQVMEYFLEDPDYARKADLNADGRVDATDSKLFSDSIGDSLRYTTLDVDGELYHVELDSTDGRYHFYRMQDEFISDEENATVTIISGGEASVYKITDSGLDAAGHRQIQLEKLIWGDMNGDGVIDPAADRVARIAGYLWDNRDTEVSIEYIEMMLDAMALTPAELEEYNLFRDT
ncbi:MAG: LamG-like jellyroll fold domain-containing protein, partial [Candidatus Omnitrophota bacterium]